MGRGTRKTGGEIFFDENIELIGFTSDCTTPARNASACHDMVDAGA